MSFARIWWDAGNFTDYPDIWEVSIDAESITGALFHSQEPRTATFSYSEPGMLDQTWAMARIKDGIFPYVVELVENWNYADEAGEMLEHYSVLFRGYVFRDGVAFKTITDGASPASNVLVATITIRDYLAVFIHYLTARPQGAAIGSGTTSFSAGTEVLIFSEMLRLWDTVPTGTGHPLWVRPALWPDIDAYPGYGMYYDGFEVYRHPHLNGYGSAADTRYYVWIELPADPGDTVSVYLKYVAVSLHTDTDWAKVKYGQVSVYGASYIITNYQQIEVQNVGNYPAIPDYNDWWDAEAANIATHLPAPLQNFYTAGSLVDMSIGVYNTDVTYSLERYDVLGDTDTFSPLNDPVRLTLTGTANTAAIRGVGEGVIPNEQFMGYMLNIYLAWLRQANGVYYLSGKLYFTTATSSGFSDAVKVTYYNEEIDSNLESFGTVYEFLQNSQLYCDKLNEYALGVYRQYPRLCAWACNEDVAVGNYVVLPRYNSALIHITEKSYDVNEPFLWHYKGRSA